MDENTSKNRVVVTDEIGGVARIRSDAEIVRENQELEDALRPKQSPDKTILDVDILAKLKMKQKAKEEVPMENKDRSLNFGVVGLGQAGNRLAETFSEFGYEACAFNTATQDLEHIKLPENKKIFLPFALGGAGKELDNGRQAVEQNAELILTKLNEIFSEKQEMLILAISGGGGTGSGGAEAIIGLMSSLSKPVGVIYVLPMESECGLTKHNSVVTLSKLAKMASVDVITPLIIVDNARIELLYPSLSKAQFWGVANKAIVEPLHLFNSLSSTATQHDSLDPMDLSRLLATGGCSVYGFLEIENYMETTMLAETVIENLESGLLASDFDLKQTKFAGFLVTGNSEVLNRLPASNIHYAQHMLNEICGAPQLFTGVYELDIPEDIVRIHTLLSGLGLPSARVDGLQKAATEQMAVIKEKEKRRGENMLVDYGATTETEGRVQEVHRLIAQKKTGFGKLTANAGKKIVDHRKR